MQVDIYMALSQVTRTAVLIFVVLVVSTFALLILASVFSKLDEAIDKAENGPTIVLPNGHYSERTDGSRQKRSFIWKQAKANLFQSLCTIYKFVKKNIRDIIVYIGVGIFTLMKIIWPVSVISEESPKANN